MIRRKYIGQQTQDDFVYPNNDVPLYDVEITHDINNNCVSGSTTGVTIGTGSTANGLQISFDYTWVKNNAEPFFLDNGQMAILSVHILRPTDDYYKPWRLVHYVSTASTGSTTVSGTVSTTITSAEAGGQFTSGTYSFEIRFIGKRCVFPVSDCDVVYTAPVTPTPTATPTPTPTPATPTPTPTPTTVCGDCYSATTINITDTGYLKWNTCSGTTLYAFVSSTGTYAIPGCIEKDSILPGFPYADVANWSSITYSGDCADPCVTPTPTPTPGTPTPTPTPGGLFALTGCGRSNTNEGGACSDASANNRTFYSTCDLANFGIGCYVYEDAAGTVPVAYTYIYIGNLGNYDTDGLTGYVTDLSSNQC